MPKPWKEVIASPQYQRLNPQQQAEAQNQYFDTVVAPQAGDQAEQAKQAFFSEYPIQEAPQNNQSPAGIVDQTIQGASEAGKSIAQAAVNTANIIPEIGDAVVSAGAWLGNKVGIGDGTYTPASRFQLPEQMQPQTGAGQVAANALPYLINPAGRAASGGLD